MFNTKVLLKVKTHEHLGKL